MNVENKNSYFWIDINIPENKQNSNEFKEQISDSVDLIYHAIEAEDFGSYKIEKYDNSRQIYIFKTKKRKRRGQLNKFCKRYLPEGEGIFYDSKGVTKDQIPTLVEKLRKTGNYKLVHEEGSSKIAYDGPDTIIFKDRTNWYAWQSFVYDKLYDSNGEINTPDNRKIVSIVNQTGNAGKSAFFKHLYCEDPLNVGRLVYGTAGQLRSAAINQGKKKIYIIDLSRTKGRADSEFDLLAIIEELKSGFLSSPMYGKSNTLVMEPPHVIISSNYVMNYEMLSEDRWEVYSLNSGTKKLGRKNALLSQAKRKKIQKK